MTTTANMATATQDTGNLFVWVSVCVCVYWKTGAYPLCTQARFIVLRWDGRVTLSWVRAGNSGRFSQPRRTTHHHHFQRNQPPTQSLPWKEIRPCTDFIKLHSQLFWIDSTTWNRPQQLYSSSRSSINSNQIKNWLPFRLCAPLHFVLLLIFTFISFYCRLWASKGKSGGVGRGARSEAGCLAAKQEAAWQLLQMAGSSSFSFSKQPSKNPAIPNLSRHSSVFLLYAALLHAPCCCLNIFLEIFLCFSRLLLQEFHLFYALSFLASCLQILCRYFSATFEGGTSGPSYCIL